MPTTGQPVRVSATISASPSLRRDFGRTLYLHAETGAQDTLLAAQRIRQVHTYPNPKTVQEDEAPSAVQTAAGIYFGQDPYPKNLMLASVIGTAQAAFVFGGTPSSVTVIEALGDNTSFELDGNAVSVDLDGVTSNTAVATAFQAGLRLVSAYSAATVTYNATDGRFEVSDDVDFNAGFTDSAASRALGLSPVSGAVVLQTAAVETVTEALNRTESLDDSFYWVVADPTISAVEADIEAVATWVAARNANLVVDFVGLGVLTQNETTSIGAQLSALQNNNVNGIYAGLVIDHKALSYAARFSSINFGVPGSLITGKFKQLPGTTPTLLTQAQRDELVRKRINYYDLISGGPGADVAEGQSFGTWTDVQVWIDWFVNALKVEVYSALRASKRIPQTAAGVAVIQDTVTRVCEEGVRNGGIAPNQVSPAMAADIRTSTGNADFTGFLSAGYLVFVVPLASQSQADRAARNAPGTKVWVKGSGAIHFADIDVTFED